MAKKYYAVKTGLTPGIYEDWETCKTQVDGYPGAEYRGFRTLEEARTWLGIEADDLPVIESACAGSDEESGGDGSDDFPDSESACIGSNEEGGGDSTYEIPAPDKGCAIAYVDGSFNEAEGLFSYGVVFFTGGQELHFAKAFDHPELLEMRNVAGEIMGSGQAMKAAKKLGCTALTIYHDYEGIAKWCTGEWKTTKPWTKAYKKFYDEISKEISVDFIKVTAHSGNKYNELADELAKDAFSKSR